MITVHHLGISQSERILWLCEELDIPYELKIYARDPTSRLAPADYKALHPMGVAPVIFDDDLVLGESGAIMDYIIHKYGNGRLALTAESPDYAAYLFWFHFANASMMPAEMSGLVISFLGIPADDRIAKSMQSRTDRCFDLVEQRLGESDYFAGSAFTAADIIMMFPLTTMRYFAPRDLSGYPNILAYLQRIGARPAYRRAMAKGDPGMELKLT